MFSLMRLLYWIFFGKCKHDVSITSTGDDNLLTRLVDVGVQTDEAPAYMSNEGSNQVVGDTVQLVNLSNGNISSAERGGNEDHCTVEININPTTSGTDSAEETGQEQARSIQSMGKVIQIVGDLGDLSKDDGSNKRRADGDESVNDSGASLNLVEEGSQSGGGLNQMAANILNIGCLDSQSTNRKSSDNFEQTTEDSCKSPHFQQNVRNSINVEGNILPRLEINMEELNQYKCTVEQHEFKIESLSDVVKDLQSQFLALQDVRPQVNTSDVNINDGQMTSRLHTLEEELLSTKMRATEMEKQLHEVTSRYNHVQQEMFNLSLDLKVDMNATKVSIGVLESRLDKLYKRDEELSGTYRVTDEDLEGMAQELENSLYDKY